MNIELTALESEALAALNIESEGNDHDFGVMEFVTWTGSRKQLGALVTTLQAKGVIVGVDKTKVDGRTLTQYVIAPAYQVRA